MVALQFYDTDTLYCIMAMHISMSSLRWGGGGLGNPQEFDCGVYPRVGILIVYQAFDLSILYSKREVNHLFLLILTILFCPGW